MIIINYLLLLVLRHVRLPLALWHLRNGGAEHFGSFRLLDILLRSWRLLVAREEVGNTTCWVEEQVKNWDRLWKSTCGFRFGFAFLLLLLPRAQPTVYLVLLRVGVLGLEARILWAVQKTLELNLFRKWKFDKCSPWNYFWRGQSSQSSPDQRHFSFSRSTALFEKWPGHAQFFGHRG